MEVSHWGRVLSFLTLCCVSSLLQAFPIFPYCQHRACIVVSSRLFENQARDSEQNSDDEGLDLTVFQQRKDKVELKLAKNQWQRPPNPFLSPLGLIRSLLEELRAPTSRQQHSGVLSLLETSTPTWRDLLRQSVGAPDNCSNEALAPPLEAALGRLNNQFAILLGVEDLGYEATFPTDPLDFEDGTCWVECRLRSRPDDQLLVVMGWSLVKRAGDGAWMVDALDWQDFRDRYRPGIGREEWMRICG